jgi:hypothetical protein
MVSLFFVCFLQWFLIRFGFDWFVFLFFCFTLCVLGIVYDCIGFTMRFFVFSMISIVLQCGFWFCIFVFVVVFLFFCFLHDVFAVSIVVSVAAVRSHMYEAL